MSEIEDWLAANYRAMQAESGRAWADMAAEMRDADVAAWMRSQAAPAAVAPKGRKSRGKSEA
jgi:hypothetical protein